MPCCRQTTAAYPRTTSCPNPQQATLSRSGSPGSVCSAESEPWLANHPRLAPGQVLPYSTLVKRQEANLRHSPPSACCLDTVPAFHLQSHIGPILVTSGSCFIARAFVNFALPRTMLRPALKQEHPPQPKSRAGRMPEQYNPKDLPWRSSAATNARGRSGAEPMHL